jgi:hypothetical protein
LVSWVIISLSFLFCCASPPSIIAESSCYCWSCGRNSVCCWLMYDSDLHPIEFLSSDDVCEDVLVMGHYSSTCCYCFEDECHCHFCSNHSSVLSVFFLGFWLLTLFFDYRSSLSFMKVDVYHKHGEVSQYLWRYLLVFFPNRWPSPPGAQSDSETRRLLCVVCNTCVPNWYNRSASLE